MTPHDQLEDLFRRVHSGNLDVGIGSASAVFWSGDRDPASGESRNRRRADELCNRSGGRHATLEMTPDGRALDELMKLARDPNLHDKLRYCQAALSQRFAASAEGSVSTFCIGSHEKSYFRGEELPTLLKNPRVNAINGVNREELRALYVSKADGRTAAYLRICQAELERDRAHALESGIDYEHRKGLLQSELGAHKHRMASSGVVRTAAGTSATLPRGLDNHSVAASHERVIQDRANRAHQVSQPISRTGKAWAEIQAQKQGDSERQAGEQAAKKDDLQQANRHSAGRDRKR